MRPNKRALVKALAGRANVSQALVERVVSVAGEVVAELAREHGECKWPGFGRFRRSPVRGVFTLPSVDWMGDYVEVEVDRQTLRYKPYRAVRDTLDRRTDDDGQGETV